MGDLGVREWTALAALLFAVMLGFVFLDPASSGSEEPLPVRYGDTPTPVLTPPAPPSALPAPQMWEVAFATLRDGSESEDTPRIIPDLNLQFEGAPFPDFRDDSWKVTAKASVGLGEGSSVLTLRYDAALRVFVNDQEVASRPEPEAGPTELSLTFEHNAGGVDIRIEATDESGPFLLQFVEAQ